MPHLYMLMKPNNIVYLCTQSFFSAGNIHSYSYSYWDRGPCFQLLPWLARATVAVL